MTISSGGKIKLLWIKREQKVWYCTLIIIVKMQNVWLKERVYIFTRYSAYINGMWNARNLGGVYKTFEFTLT